MPVFLFRFQHISINLTFQMNVIVSTIHRQLIYSRNILFKFNLVPSLIYSQSKPSADDSHSIKPITTPKQTTKTINQLNNPSVPL